MRSANDDRHGDIHQSVLAPVIQVSAIVFGQMHLDVCITFTAIQFGQGMDEMITGTYIMVAHGNEDVFIGIKNTRTYSRNLVVGFQQFTYLLDINEVGKSKVGQFIPHMMPVRIQPWDIIVCEVI